MCQPLICSDLSRGESATNKAFENLVKAAEKGLPFTDSVTERLNESEKRWQALPQVRFF